MKTLRLVAVATNLSVAFHSGCYRPQVPVSVAFAS
jgi:hypothetical protein